MDPRYAFIVGSSRTGSSLLVRCLNRSDEICMLGQTHFMGHLYRSGLRHEMAKFGSLTDDKVVYKLVDYLYSAPYRGGDYWIWLLKNVDKAYFTQKLLASNRTERAFFYMLMELKADKQPVWGEKTPGNLFHVPTLLEWFPQAKIIHTFRDPRAIYVSESKYRIAQQDSRLFPYKQMEKLGLKNMLVPLYTVFHTTIVWSKVWQLHLQYAKDYPNNYYLLKFEDFVTNPAQQLQQLCQFLEIKFREEMLDQVVFNTGFKSEVGKAGFDRETADRWKRHINPLAKAWFFLRWRQPLQELGYGDSVARSELPELSYKK